MKAARAALRAGQPQLALEILANLKRDTPHGLLLQEREALRIESLAASGGREAASRAARDFIARYPESPNAARLKAIAGSEQATP